MASRVPGFAYGLMPVLAISAIVLGSRIIERPLRISSSVATQFITVLPCARPFWRLPIFNVGFLKDGASASPLEELPMTAVQCVNAE